MGLRHHVKPYVCSDLGEIYRLPNVSLWGTQRGQGGRDTPSPPWPRWSQHDDDGEDDCDFEFLLGCVTQRIWEVSYRRHGCLFPFDFEMKSRFENVCPRFSFDDIFTFTIHVKAYTYRKHKSACYTCMAESDLLYENPRNSLEKQCAECKCVIVRKLWFRLMIYLINLCINYMHVVFLPQGISEIRCHYVKVFIQKM